MNTRHCLLIRGDNMVMLERDNSYSELDIEFSKRGIQISEKMNDLIKDILEDNPSVSLSYKGVEIESFNDELFFKDVNSQEFIIYGGLSESDEDNLRIHGISGKYENGNFILEEPKHMESSVDNVFNRTHMF